MSDNAILAAKRRMGISKDERAGTASARWCGQFLMKRWVSASLKGNPKSVKTLRDVHGIGAKMSRAANLARKVRS